MSKKTQGFSSQGGRGPVPKTQVRYSPDEMSAMSKLGTGATFGLGGGATVLCNVCGAPVTSKSRYERPDDKFDAIAQLEHREHFACTMHAQRTRAELAAKSRASLSPDELEELEAQEFNKSNTSNDKPMVGEETGRVYVPKPGELPLSKIIQAGGISKALMPELGDGEIEFAPEEDPIMIAQTKEYEERVRREFEEAKSQGLV